MFKIGNNIKQKKNNIYIVFLKITYKYTKCHVNKIVIILQNNMVHVVYVVDYMMVLQELVGVIVVIADNQDAVQQVLILLDLKVVAEIHYVHGIVCLQNLQWIIMQKIIVVRV